MQSHIAITVHPALGPVVSGRELYPLITKSKAARNVFSDWFREKEKRFSLKNGEDFIVASVMLADSTSNRGQIEFILTLKTAKLLCKEAPAKRGLTTLAYLDAYGKGPTSFVEGNTVLSPNAVRLGLAHLSREAAAVATLPFGPVEESAPIEKMESYLSGLAPISGPIETKAQRLRRELAEAEEAERLEALRQSTPTAGIDPQRLDAIEERLNTQGSKLNALLKLFQKGASILASQGPIPVEEPTTRTKVNRIVDAYASHAKMEHAAVWKFLYGQLLEKHNIDVYMMVPGKKDPNYLEAVEAAGKIDLLYSIAQATLTRQPATGATA